MWTFVKWVMWSAWGLMALIVGVWMLSGSTPDSHAPQSAPDPFTIMTPAEHIAELKKALSEWKPHQDPRQTYWGRLDDAERHYYILPTEDKRRPDVVKLKTELERRKKESSRLTGIATREILANALEKKYLDQGTHGQGRLCWVSP